MQMVKADVATAPNDRIIDKNLLPNMIDGQFVKRGNVILVKDGHTLAHGLYIVSPMRVPIRFGFQWDKVDIEGSICCFVTGGRTNSNKAFIVIGGSSSSGNSKNQVFRFTTTTEF